MRSAQQADQFWRNACSKADCPPRSLTRLFPSKTVEEEPLICAELWGRPLGLHSSLFGSYLTSSNKIALGRCDRTWMQTVAWPSMWKELSCREWKTHATTFLALVSHPRFGQTSTLALPKMTLSQGTFHKLKAKLPRLVSLDLTQVRGLNETRFASMVDNFASLTHLRLDSLNFGPAQLLAIMERCTALTTPRC